MESADLMLVAYIGPETFLPLLSVLVAALGAVLAFGKYIGAMIVSVLKGFVNVFRRK